MNKKNVSDLETLARKIADREEILKKLKSIGAPSKILEEYEIRIKKSLELLWEGPEAEELLSWGRKYKAVEDAREKIVDDLVLGRFIKALELLCDWYNGFFHGEADAYPFSGKDYLFLKEEWEVFESILWKLKKEERIQFVFALSGILNSARIDVLLQDWPEFPQPPAKYFELRNSFLSNKSEQFKTI